METFVVRIWTPSDAAERTGDRQPGELHGVVVHSSTGTETPFNHQDELLRILRTFLAS